MRDADSLWESDNRQITLGAYVSMSDLGTATNISYLTHPQIPAFLANFVHLQGTSSGLLPVHSLESPLIPSSLRQRSERWFEFAP